MIAWKSTGSVKATGSQVSLNISKGSWRSSKCLESKHESIRLSWPAPYNLRWSVGAYMPGMLSLVLQIIPLEGLATGGWREQDSHNALLSPYLSFFHRNLYLLLPDRACFFLKLWELHTLQIFGQMVSWWKHHCWKLEEILDVRLYSSLYRLTFLYYQFWLFAHDDTWTSRAPAQRLSHDDGCRCDSQAGAQRQLETRR